MRSKMSFQSMLSSFTKVFNREQHLTVTFYLRGGSAVTTHGVKEVKITKTNEGNFNSYAIEWYEGQKPALFSVALDHIDAIVAEKA